MHAFTWQESIGINILALCVEMLLGALASGRQTSMVQGDVHTVKGAVGSRCGEAISQIVLWNVVGSRGAFRAWPDLLYPSLDSPQSPGVDFLLSASVNHVLEDPHTLAFHKRAKSSDISV